MAIQGVDTKCYILALFVRDDGERFLLGSGHYEFKDTQMHFAANAIQNDIVEVQGNDGFLLAGQVRRPGTQSFDGYVGDGTMSKEETESYRRQFFSFFRKNFFYKVIYVFSDGTAIQRKSGFLVDDPTVEELYQMYPEYHVALNFEDVNYYSYSEDEEGQEQYAKEATIDTSSMRATGGLVWDNLGVVWEATQWGGEQTASGTEMVIQNEMNVPSIVDGIRLDGDTEQQTYSGINLFNYLDRVQVDSSYSIDNDGWITLEYTNTGSSAKYANYYTGSLDLLENTTYALVYEIKNVSYSGTASPSITFVSTASTQGQSATSVFARFVNLYNGEVATETFTTRDDFSVLTSSYGLRTFTNIPSGSSCSITFRISVLADTSVTPETFVYQPYTGGIPSPNPDYPQEVQTVTGEQTVAVTGKNLFNINAISGSNSAAQTSTIGKSLTVTAVSASTAMYAIVIENSDDLLGKECTLSIGEASTSAESATTGRLAIYNGLLSNPTSVSGNIAYSTGIVSGSTLTFTFPNSYASGKDCFCILFYASSASSANTRIGDTSTYSDIQLEIGSTATSYEQYRSQAYTIDLGTTELCKIGDYQDYIYKSGDDWFVHKACGKVTYDGNSSENWSYDSSYPRVQIGLADNMRAYASNAYCTHLTTGNTATASSDNVFNIGGAALFMKATSVATSKGAWMTWLTTHNVSLYYSLATPTDTRITNTALIGQLNALGAMRLFIGENNLAIQAAGTNLPAPLSFKYYTTVAMTGAEWEEGGSGGATVVEVDSITNTYPIWRVKGPAVDPQLSVINTNTTIRYTGTVTSTQTLEIDMFNKTAKLNGVSVIGNVSGDWVSLAPGTNRVIYTAENADAQPSTIEWQEVVG